MATTKWILKYEPIGSGVDLFYLPVTTSTLNLAALFSSISAAIAVGILHRTCDEEHAEAVVMQVDVEEDTVLPSKDVRDQPLPPR